MTKRRMKKHHEYIIFMNILITFSIFQSITNNYIFII